MYTVGREKLPTPSCVAESVELMAESLAGIQGMPYAKGLQFSGEVLCPTEDPERFEVTGLHGRVTSMTTEPPAFNLLLEEACVMTGPCDCPDPTPDLDLIFEDFGQALAEAQIAADCEEFAGVPTQDPHVEAIAIAKNTEVTVRFDRLGWYGVVGIIGQLPDSV